MGDLGDLGTANLQSFQKSDIYQGKFPSWGNLPICPRRSEMQSLRQSIEDEQIERRMSEEKERVRREGEEEERRRREVEREEEQKQEREALRQEIERQMEEEKESRKIANKWQDLTKCLKEVSYCQTSVRMVILWWHSSQGPLN